MELEKKPASPGVTVVPQNVPLLYADRVVSFDIGAYTSRVVFAIDSPIRPIAQLTVVVPTGAVVGFAKEFLLSVGQQASRDELRNVYEELLAAIGPPSESR